MTRADLQKLAELRIEEAEILLKARKYAGAYYLAGYAVECGLKACVAKKTKRFEFPDKQLVLDSYTHTIEKLVSVAGLKSQRDADAASDTSLLANWGTVKDWTEESRYERTRTRAEAYRLFNAITDPRHGVLPWIKQRW